MHVAILPFRRTEGCGDAAQTKLVIVRGAAFFGCGRWNDAAQEMQYTPGIFVNIHH